MFDLLDSKKITLLSKKSYLNYLTITLLNQKIDTFEFIVVTNKIATIKKLDFSYNFIDLKLYLKLTKYLRNYIFYYAQKSKVLQQKKVVLLRLFLSNKSRLQKIYNQRIVIDLFTNKKFNFYCQLEFFDRSIFLIYFDRDRILYIDINVSKKREFNIIIYYLKLNANSKKLRTLNIQSIFFLSCPLNFAKIKY